QEVDALRQGIEQMGTRSTFNDAAPGAGGAPADGTTASTAPPLAVGTSPDKLFDSAWSDYGLSQWDLAIAGFEAFLRAFPKSEKADDAQVLIGNCYLGAGKNDKAVEAYDLAIRAYPGGNALPEAYYRKGIALKNLKQADRARDAFDTVVKNYPNSAEASLARQ